MGTRCQVKVTQLGAGWDQSITLYHHFDGYPEGMLPLFKMAFDGYLSGEIFIDPRKKEMMMKYMDIEQWQLGRAGKAAGIICCADPGGFEPEEGHVLHGDIEWYYVVDCVNTKGGSSGEHPTWKIHIYEPVYSEHDVSIGEEMACVDVHDIDEWLKKRGEETPTF